MILFIFFPKSIEKFLPQRRVEKKSQLRDCNDNDHHPTRLFKKFRQVSFAPRFLVHEGSTQSNFLLARRKVFRRSRDSSNRRSSLLLLPSLNERGTNEGGEGEMDAGPRRLALIRWLGGNDKERKIIGLSVAALFNPLPPRGELFLSALGERERERREGWSVRRKKDPEEVVSFRRFSFSHRCRRRRSPSLSLSFFSLFFLPRPLHTRSSPSLI